jgi:hypothetical protein
MRTQNFLNQTLAIAALFSTTSAGALDPDWQLIESFDIGHQGVSHIIADQDLDGDGVAELVVFGHHRRFPNVFVYKTEYGSNWNRIWEGGHPKTSRSPWTVPIGTVADVTGDGVAELLITQHGEEPGDHAVHIFKFPEQASASDAGASTPIGSLVIGAPIVAVTVGDLDGNSRPEIIVATADAERALLIHEWDGNSKWREPVVSSLGGQINGLSAMSPIVHDLDEDGRGEIGVLAAGGSHLKIVGWLGQGHDPHIEHAQGPFGGLRHYSRIAIGDLNADGRAELVASDYHQGTFHVIKSTGPDAYRADEPGGLRLNINGVSPVTILPPVESAARGAALVYGVQVSDTGEGRDLFLSEYSAAPGGTLTIKNFTAERRIDQMAFPPTALAVADVNGDGQVELIVGTRENPDGAEVHIYSYRPTGPRADAKPAANETPTLDPGFAVPTDMQHLIVYGEEGRFCGWPANEGLWTWDGGREILVGFEYANFLLQDDYHDMDRNGPKRIALARSTDSGQTWTMTLPDDIHEPEFLENPDLHPVDFDRVPAPCPGGYDFTNPNFAMKSRGNTFYFSQDRGHTWDGPFLFPEFRAPLLMARTDYVVVDNDSLIAFITSSLTDGDEGRPFATRTDDGGATWEFLGWMAPEPPRAQDGVASFSIMPATVSVGERSLITALRQRAGRRRWIDIYRSDDGGEFWEYVATPSEGASNPPALVRLNDGRLCLIYGWRQQPFGVRARLSSDEGKTWGPQIVLREDGRNWDLGYPRVAQRPDGKVVAIYYYSTPEQPQQFIAATIFDPDSLVEKE